jgi:hypothetical protein
LARTRVRAYPFHPDDTSIYERSAREIKVRVREGTGAALLFAGASGAFKWSCAALDPA